MGINLKCPIHNKELEQINIRFQSVGYCRDCQQEYYQLPDGKLVNRHEFHKVERDMQ